MAGCAIGDQQVEVGDLLAKATVACRTASGRVTRLFALPLVRALRRAKSQAPAPCGGQKARLLHLGYRILFFTRIRKQAAKGVTEPFLFLGPGKFLDATGNRPIAIRWQLAHAMPTAHYREARLVSGMQD